MMGWAVGYDNNWTRDVGYGVPATCDHPDCGKAIHRGLSYVCGGDVFGGDEGCGLYFCGTHLLMDGRGPQRCERCLSNEEPFSPTPDSREWLEWKLSDQSWAEWRTSCPDEVAVAQEILRALPEETKS